MMHGELSLRKTLEYSGVSRHQWYYKPKLREVELNPDVVAEVRRMSKKRPTYGTRRMAAQVTRNTKTATNRKQIQCIFRKIDYIQPQKTKNDIIRTRRKLFKPEAPNQLWEADITYIQCGMDGWCYSCNIIDCYTREWVAYVFDTRATRHEVISTLTKAVAVAKPDCSQLRLRTDNDNQYTSHDFKRAVKALGIGTHEFIWKNTPEQNGHIESFPKALKKEYIWIREFANYQEAEQALAEAFEDYNHERIHSAIEYKTPAEFATEWEERHK